MPAMDAWQFGQLARNLRSKAVSTRSKRERIDTVVRDDEVPEASDWTARDEVVEEEEDAEVLAGPSSLTSTPASTYGAGYAENLEYVYGSYGAGVEGNGASGGMVIPLDMTGDGTWEAVYTLSALLSSSRQNVSLQVDTGSADLWVVSSQCSASLCSQVDGNNYNPSISSTPTGDSFSITYYEGSASGPIVWDYVAIGGYNLSNQALAAVTSVTSEPISQYFDGILGLGLESLSVIAQVIPPESGDNNTPDGAPFSSNLFGLTPVSDAPASRFLALSLARPGSNRVPSFFAIGLHPSFIASNSSQSGLAVGPADVPYSNVLIPNDAEDATYWRVEVTGVSVWVDGVEKVVNVELGPETTVNGGIFAQALLDSGTPTIVANKGIADGIYGALGITQSSDGNYYISCTTPINMTFAINGHPPLAMHPLDLTSTPQDDPSSSMCMGTIQVPSTPLTIADMILGVAFLRSTYMVMAYEQPNGQGFIGNASVEVESGAQGVGSANGTTVGGGEGAATTITTAPSTSTSTNATSTSTTASLNGTNSVPSTTTTAGSPPSETVVVNPYAVNPMIGLLGLTNSTIALSEFNIVRVQKEALPSVAPNGTIISGSGGSGGGPSQQDNSSGGRHGLSTGLIVLVALLSFLGLLVCLFGTWWVVMRRRFRDEGEDRKGDGQGEDHHPDVAAHDDDMLQGGYAPVTMLGSHHSRSYSNWSTDREEDATLRSTPNSSAVLGKRKSAFMASDVGGSGVWVEQPQAQQRERHESPTRRIGELGERRRSSHSFPEADPDATLRERGGVAGFEFRPFSTASADIGVADGGPDGDMPLQDDGSSAPPAPPVRSRPRPGTPPAIVALSSSTAANVGHDLLPPLAHLSDAPSPASPFLPLGHTRYLSEPLDVDVPLLTGHDRHPSVDDARPRGSIDLPGPPVGAFDPLRRPSIE